MLQELHMQIDAPLSVLPLLLSQHGLLGYGDRFQNMLVTVGMHSDAVLAEVEIVASRAIVSIPDKNLAAAVGALLNKLGRLTIMKVPQDHHTRVLRPPKRVELIVVTLAQIQECLPVVQELTVQVLLIIIDDLQKNWGGDVCECLGVVERRGSVSVCRANS